MLMSRALCLGCELDQPSLDVAKRPEPVHRRRWGGGLGVAGSLMVAQRRQCLDHPGVPVPAGRDHPNLDGKAVDELLDPFAQFTEGLQSLGLAKGWPVDRVGELAERFLE